jgi:putative transposase
MAEIRVFYNDRFLCRAISAELAGKTVPLRKIVRIRNSRRKELRKVLSSRQKTVDVLLQLKKGPIVDKPSASAANDLQPAAHIKRYRNE